MTDERDVSTFQQMLLDDEQTVGPLGLLFFGHERAEAAAVAALLTGDGNEGVPFACVTTTMAEWTVERALAGDDDGTLLPVGKVPRILLLSGLSNRLVHELLDRFERTGLPRPIFAVATPTNLAFTVLQLMSDLIAERQAVGEG